MKLIWHIAKKDLRRMALPVGGWLAFMAATTIWFRLSHPPTGDALMAEVDVWTRLMRIWTQLLAGAKIVIAYLLVGALVLEDALPGTREFWQTRPLAGARLLAAKLLAAGVLFVAAPLAILSPLWLASGFGASDLAGAAREFAVGQAMIVTTSLAMASLAGNLAQFLFSSLSLAVGYVACAYFGAWGADAMDRATVAVERSRMMLPGYVLWTAMVVVSVHQFLTRRSARSWAIVAVALAAGLAVRVAWPSEVRLSVTPSLPQAAAVEIAPQLTKQKDSNDSANGYFPPILAVSTSWNSAGFFVPTGGWLDDGRIAMKLGAGWQIAGERALGFSSAQSPIAWRLLPAFRTPWTLTPENAPTWHGQLSIWFTTPHVLGEMPLREGATIVAGATRTRILGFARTGGTIDRVFLEVRDARAGAGDGVRALLAPSYGSDWVDEYFRIDRAHNTAVPERREVIGAVAMHSLLVTNEQVHLTTRETDHDVSLAIVRFERVREYVRPIEVHGMKWEEPR